MSSFFICVEVVNVQIFGATTGEYVQISFWLDQRLHPKIHVRSWSGIKRQKRATVITNQRWSDAAHEFRGRAILVSGSRLPCLQTMIHCQAAEFVRVRTDHFLLTGYRIPVLVTNSSSNASSLSLILLPKEPNAVAQQLVFLVSNRDIICTARVTVLLSVTV